MATEIVKFTDINQASLVEDMLPSGIYDVKFYVTDFLSPIQLSDLKASLVNSGVDVKNVYQSFIDGMKYIGVDYQRTIYGQGISQLPIAIIGLIGTALIPILVGIGIFKIDSIANSVTKILLVGGGIAIVLAVVLKKPLEKVIERR